MGYFSQVYRDLPPMTAWENLSSYLELLADMCFVRAPVFPRFGLLYCKRNSGRSFCGAGRTVGERDTCTVRQSASAASALATLTPFQMGSFRRWSRIFGTFCGEVSLLSASSLYPKGGTRISRTSKLDTIAPCPEWQVRTAIARIAPLRPGAGPAVSNRNANQRFPTCSPEHLCARASTGSNLRRDAWLL